MDFMIEELETAFHWLCIQRKHFPANADVWDFRRTYTKLKHHLLDQVNNGLYAFSVQQRVVKANGSVIHLWSSQDALVMKLLADRLQGFIQPSKRCTHVRGHGGLKATLVEIQQHIGAYQFVCKTDVYHYYESIDQYQLVDRIADYVSDPILRHYLYQIIHRAVEYGGTFKDVDAGISRGCPLSPLLGALYLKELDQLFEDRDCFYVRYMDDILILSRTRWQNRKAVKMLNQCLNKLKLHQHPDKTFIGRIDKGFDFLGYHISGKQMTVAHKTVNQHVLHYRRLYEQLRKRKATSEEMASILGLYVKRWQRWVAAGLQGIRLEPYDVVRNRDLLSLEP